MPEHNRNNTQRNVNDSGCMNKLDGNNLQGIDILLQSDVGKQIPPATESYGQAEREIIIYIKKCIKHHQSLLT
jgi:hypothetical protein